MTQLLWLAAAAVALMIWLYGHRRFREDQLGTMSAQWLHDYHRATHQDD